MIHLNLKDPLRVGRYPLGIPAAFLGKPYTLNPQPDPVTPNPKP